MSELRDKKELDALRRIWGLDMDIDPNYPNCLVVAGVHLNNYYWNKGLTGLMVESSDGEYRVYVDEDLTSCNLPQGVPPDGVFAEGGSWGWRRLNFSDRFSVNSALMKAFVVLGYPPAIDLLSPVRDESQVAGARRIAGGIGELKGDPVGCPAPKDAFGLRPRSKGL